MQLVYSTIPANWVEEKLGLYFSQGYVYEHAYVCVHIIENHKILLPLYNYLVIAVSSFSSIANWLVISSQIIFLWVELLLN